MNNITIIFGAPGCGKTTRLMEILEKELKENEPNKIAFVSFTKKGTYEGRDRAIDKFGFKVEDFPYFRTLHSIAFRELKISKYDMISKKDYKEFSLSMGMNFTGYYTEEFYNNDDRYLFHTFLERNNPKTAKQFIQEMDIKKLNIIRDNYIRYKKFANIVDFTDLIEIFVKRNIQLPVDIAIIDEAQDLTSLQWEMCEIAFKNCKRVYIAGDDDQAIYEWSGADVQYFINLKGTKETLKRSYRLSKTILEFSKNISNQIKERVEKDFEPNEKEGNVYFYNTVEEIKINPNDSYYFLCRNNWFLHQFIDVLKRQSEVFFHKDKFSVNHRDIQAINTFEQIRKTGKMDDQQRLKLQPYLKDTMNIKYPWFNNFNLDIDTTAYYRDLIRNKVNLKNSKIMVNTIHGVKGGEADHVVLMLDFTKAVRENMENNPDSELRCLYVACTRAKKALHIVYSNSSNGYDFYIDF